MFGFIVAVALALVALAFVVGSFVMRDPGSDGVSRGAVFGIGAVAGLLALVVLFISMFTTVSSNSVGIETEFGKPVGTLDPGPHLLAPWASVEEFSTRIQVTDRLAGPQGDVPGADCVQVNLKGGQQGCADITVQYQINAKDAVELWRRYGDFTTVRDRLLRSATDNAAKVVYGNYAAMDAINGENAPTFNKLMTVELQKQLSTSGVTIVAVFHRHLNLPANVQAQIDQIINAQTQTQVANENLARNQAQSKANDALTQSLNPQVIAQHCLDIVEQTRVAMPCVPGAGGFSLK